MVVVLLRLKVIMARRRRLKKSDQVVAEEIVVSSNELQIVVFSHQATVEGIVVFSDQPIGEQNVGPSKLRHQK